MSQSPDRTWLAAVRTEQQQLVARGHAEVDALELAVTLVDKRRGQPTPPRPLASIGDVVARLYPDLNPGRSHP